MSEPKNPSRRDVVKQAALAGAAVAVAGPGVAQAGKRTKKQELVRARAAFDTSGELRPFTFERRPMGPDDIVIDIKYASICHSDIHQERGDWGPQQYPQVPGHEIAGIVAAVGANVTTHKVGVGYMEPDVAVEAVS